MVTTALQMALWRRDHTQRSIGDGLIHHCLLRSIGIGRFLRKVLAQQPVDASMSSGWLIPGGAVLPGRLVGGHRPVDDVDEVALQDASGAAIAFGRCVASE